MSGVHGYFSDILAVIVVTGSQCLKDPSKAINRKIAAPCIIIREYVLEFAVELSGSEVMEGMGCK